MKRLYIPACLFVYFFFIACASAQDLADSRTSSYYTFIYKLSNRQAESLYRDIWRLENDYLTVLHDFFPTDSVYDKKLPVGHYLFVSAKDGNFEGALESVNNLDMKLLNNHRDLMMVFHDSAGREITDVTVVVKRKKVKLDRKTKSYRLKKSNKQGLVSATYEGHTSYFEIDRQHNNGLFIRTGRKIVRSFPVRHLISPVLYLKNNVQTVVNGGRPYWPPIVYKARRLFRPTQYRGFVAFNKPEYKPGDTVKLKAFVTTPKGKPYKRAATLQLKQYHPEYASRQLATLKPFRDGAYTYEFKLDDSLKLLLDRSYTIELGSKAGHALVSNDFRFADYELKNNVYAVRSENTDRARPASLFLKATDSNDMPLFDIRAEVLVKPSAVHQYDEDHIFIKDTLWFHRTALEAIGETKIDLPDSVMPDASIDYTATVSFLNSENESVVKAVDLSYNHRALPISITIEKDSLIVAASRPGLELPNLRLETFLGNEPSAKPVQLPHREKLNSFVQRYSIQDGKRHKTVNLDEEEDQLQILASRTQDSLFIAADNPRKISFRYFLFRNRSLIQEGEGNGLAIRKHANANDSYSLSVQYIWAGQAMSKEFNVPFDRKNLAIKIDHSPIVYPGEHAKFTISVDDAFGNPVENVDLTAYAITKKFPAQDAPSVPNLAKPKRSRAAFNAFSTRDIDTDIRKRLDYSFWRKTLGLDSLTFYQFMFPDSGYFENRSHADVSQFAPFVIGYGIETIAVIYVDGRPVYYNDVQTLQPYSFAVKPGIHDIQLRLRNALITVQNVRIDSAQKLIFSIDRFKLPRNCRAVAMPDKFTEAELTKLSRHFVQVKWNSRNPDAFVAQGDRFHLFNKTAGNYYGGYQLVGPFFPGKASYFEKDGFHLTFDYEPFSSYEFKKDILKIRDFNAANALRTDRFGWYTSAIPSFDDEVLTQQKAQAYWQNNQLLRVNPFRRFPDFKAKTNHVGKLTLEYFGERHDQYLTKATFIVNLDNPDEYYVLPHSIKNEPFHQGRYQAVILLHDTRYVKADSILVKPHGTSYYNLFSKYQSHPADSFSNNVLQLIEKWSSPENYYQRERALELQRLRSLYYQESTADYTFTHTVSGKITGENGEGIPGVNVVVKGTAVGTATDMDGNYTIRCPEDGTLVFSFIGYQTQERSISSQEAINARMVEDVAHLSEVVVVGYGVQRSPRYLTSSVALAGSAPGVYINGMVPGAADSVSIRIRGLTSANGNVQPLVILDGRIVLLSDVNKSSVTAMEVIRPSDAVALYGSRAAGGVILMSTKAGATKKYLHEMSEGFTPTPVLEEVPGNSLRKNFRDYAFWQPRLKTDEHGRATFHATFPDDITGWNAYVLGMATKRRTGQTSSSIRSYKPLLAQIALPSFFIEGDVAAVLGKITNYGRDTLQLQRTIKVDDQLIDDGPVTLTRSSIDTIFLRPQGPDSISVEYTVAVKGYRDGELRHVPVLKKGVLEAKGKFYALASDTTFSLDFSDASTPVRLYANADLMDVLIDELDFLRSYAYECNEQLASKLRGLLLEKAISKHRQLKFSSNHDIQKLARKLATVQNDDGSWGWWKGGAGEIWITLHVARSLLKAEESGHRTVFDQEKLVDYLESQLSALPVGTQLEVMIFLAEQGQALKAMEIIDSVRSSKKSTVREKLLAERLSQMMGHTIDWTWVNSMRSETIKGNYYWGEDKPSVHDNAILNTLVVYEMAAGDRSYKELSRIEGYFLEARKKHWRSTYESSLILEPLLREAFTRGPVQAKPALELSGSAARKISTFPFEMSIPPGTLTVTKTGASPVYFTAYTEEWSSTPDQRDTEFAVRTSFEDGERLTAGKPVQLVIELEVKRDAEYIMIEVPIPAGCSYQTKAPHRLQGEVHREHYNHKTNIYCRDLKKGKYTYTIRLLPRYSGTYALNPATVECMYFPTLYGRERMKNVVIK